MFFTGAIGVKTKDEILNIISQDEFKNIFFKNEIYNVIIFGSLSKGNFTVESDIDIAIISSKKISINQELVLTAELEELLGRSIDLININDENVNNIIKIEALNSKLIVARDDILDETIEYYDKFYKENEEFWYLLDKEVLGYE